MSKIYLFKFKARNNMTKCLESDIYAGGFILTLFLYGTVKIITVRAFPYDYA